MKSQKNMNKFITSTKTIKKTCKKMKVKFLLPQAKSSWRKINRDLTRPVHQPWSIMLKAKALLHVTCPSRQFSKILSQISIAVPKTRETLWIHSQSKTRRKVAQAIAMLANRWCNHRVSDLVPLDTNARTTDRARVIKNRTILSLAVLEVVAIIAPCTRPKAKMKTKTKMGN